MAFNSDNDLDLLTSVDFLGKNFSNRRNDPSIHIGRRGKVIKTSFDNSYVMVNGILTLRKESFRHTKKNEKKKSMILKEIEMILKK